MRTSITVGLALAACAWATGLPGARAQAPQQEVCFIAAYIDYSDIKNFDPVKGAALPDRRDLVFDDAARGQSCCVDLVGTPPNEKVRLTCQDRLIPAPGSPININGFGCMVFNGRRGGNTGFELTNKTTFSVDGQGRVTMRCTAN